MTISITEDVLTTSTTKVLKTRYFSIELQCVSMVPNTQYDIYVEGVLMNAFCKPYGKNLGDPLISGPDGRLLVQYLMSIPYNQQYLTIKADVSGYMAKSQMIEFRDPSGRSSVTYIPIRMKVTQ